MAEMLKREKYAMAIIGPLAAKYLRSNSSPEELDSVAAGAWKLADAMERTQGNSAGFICRCQPGDGGRCG